MWQAVNDYWPLAWKVGSGLFALITAYGIKALYPALIRASKAQVGQDMCKEELKIYKAEIQTLRREIAELQNSSEE